MTFQFIDFVIELIAYSCLLVEIFFIVNGLSCFFCNFAICNHR